MSRVRENLIRKLVRELIKQEIDEANSTASVGGSYNTPHAFGGSNKKGKKKGKAGYKGGHTEPTDGTGHFIADDPKLRKESVKEARTINVEPNWEGMWRFFKRMAKTNPRDWKKMERKLGGEWLKIDKMAQQKGWKSESVNESGIMYRAGVKKYGKEGMTKIQQAAGKKASHAKIGKIKDKYDKTREIPKEVTEDAKDVTKAKKLSQKLQNIEGRYRKVMYDLSDRLQADDKNHKLQDELIKSYTKNVTSFMRDMIKITKRVK